MEAYVHFLKLLSIIAAAPISQYKAFTYYCSRSNKPVQSFHVSEGSFQSIKEHFCIIQSIENIYSENEKIKKYEDDI